MPTIETNTYMVNLVTKLKQRNAKLEDALLSLIDGLDSNYDERCGLTNKQWEERIRDARKVLKEN